VINRQTILVFLAAFSATAFAADKRFSDEAVDAIDIAAIRKSFQSDENDRKLRDRTKRFADGAYGYSFDVSRRVRKFSDDPVMNRELELKSMLCISEAVAIVVAKGAKSFMTPARSMVYTKYRLDVVNSIATTPAAANRNQVFAIQSGGEVTEGGEKFRVRNQDSPELLPEETYVAFLNSLEDKRLFHIIEAIPVRNGKVFPNKSEFGGLSAGMTLEEVTSAAQKVRATYCPNMGAKQ